MVRHLLPALGYEWAPANHPLDDRDEVPVLCAVGGKAGGPALLAPGAYDAEAEGEDPLKLKPHRLQFDGEAPPPEALLRKTWDQVVTLELIEYHAPFDRCDREEDYRTAWVAFARWTSGNEHDRS